MKLTELNPRWTGYASNDKRDEQIINGLTFLCPHCGKETGRRLGVLFHPPIDEGGWLAKGVTIFHGAVEWTRTGDTFETLDERLAEGKRVYETFHNPESLTSIGFGTDSIGSPSAGEEGEAAPAPAAPAPKPAKPGKPAKPAATPAPAEPAAEE